MCKLRPCFLTLKQERADSCMFSFSYFLLLYTNDRPDWIPSFAVLSAWVTPVWLLVPCVFSLPLDCASVGEVGFYCFAYLYPCDSLSVSIGNPHVLPCHVLLFPAGALIPTFQTLGPDLSPPRPPSWKFHASLSPFRPWRYMTAQLHHLPVWPHDAFIFSHFPPPHIYYMTQIDRPPPQLGAGVWLFSITKQHFVGPLTPINSIVQSIFPTNPPSEEV